MLRFACPGCRAAFSVSEDRAGKKARCPKCGLQFLLPGPQARPGPPPLGAPPSPTAAFDFGRPDAETPDDYAPPRGRRGGGGRGWVVLLLICLGVPLALAGGTYVMVRMEKKEATPADKGDAGTPKDRPAGK